MSRSGVYISSIIPGFIGVCVFVFLSQTRNLNAKEMSGFTQNQKTQQNKPDSATIIINKYLAALGGIEKLESIKSLYMEGTINIRGQKAQTKVWTIGNHAARNEFTINGFTNWSITRTDSGWSYNPRRGQKFPEPMTADMIKLSQPGLDVKGTLVDYKDKGYKIEYKGIDQIEGSDVYVIEEKLNESITKTFYIDLDSYLIIRVHTKSVTKNKVTYSNADYSNYKKTTDGYMFAMTVGNINYKTITVNPEINEAIFIPKK